MSLCDPIADMLTRIRNAQMVEHREVCISFSKMNIAILNVLLEEGYILDFKEIKREGSTISQIQVTLKYYAGAPVIDKIIRVSRPGLRVYKKAAELQPVLNGLGIAVVSTSYGVMTDKQARQKHIGGELLCTVS